MTTRMRGGWEWAGWRSGLGRGRAGGGLIALMMAVLLMSRAWVGAAEELTLTDLEGASRVAGVAFTVAEKEMMLAGVRAHQETLSQLRSFPWSGKAEPALLFDPRPVGFVGPVVGKVFRWEPPRVVRVPLNDVEFGALTVAELSGLIRQKRVSSEQLTLWALERLKRYGDRLRCVVRLTEARALESARRADEELKRGRWRGPLHGIPYGVKDLFDVRGTPTTCGVTLWTQVMAEEDATVVRKMEEAGAILVAKLSLGELAMGDVWYGGLTRNPWNPDEGSSGSSAGSASAVAAGLIPMAIGTETLGSIVSPSTVCAVTGLRPTYGRVSRHGAMTLCPTMDKVGPLCRTAEDCALVLDVIRGSDGWDRSVVDMPLATVQGARVRALRVGYLARDFEGTDGSSKEDAAVLEWVKKAGWTVKPVEWARIPSGPLYSILLAEAAASFDDLTRSNQDDLLVQQKRESWPNTFRTARFQTAVDYLQAQRLRGEVMREMQRVFREVDVLVAPSFRGRQLLYSNLSGHPCVVVPNADPRSGQRSSICFLAGLYREMDAVAVAMEYQRATDWHRHRPPGFP